MSADEIAAFLTARTVTSRNALNRWLRAQAIDMTDPTAVELAKARWLGLSLLASPPLKALSRRAAESARGRIIDAGEPFRFTAWNGGRYHVAGGQSFSPTLTDFVGWLEQLAKRVAAKGEGAVIEPTTNTDGRRVNESTVAMHALFLDCDGRGEWHRLLEVLTSLGYALVAYQSGGWSPTNPKWRIILPLAQPFDTSSEDKREGWKLVYNHARVVFGCLGELLAGGFDPATETPCNPWYLCERRRLEDPPRQVVWRVGHTLDLVGFMLALPAVEPEFHAEGGACVQHERLEDERLEEIVAALTKMTANVPANRRELYMSLSGALLDRGVDPDDMVIIIEAVSERYPRRHTDKHKDHVRIAHTTAAKYERGEPYTRIGTLFGAFPEVAAVVDELFPDTFAQAVREMLARREQEKSGPSQSSPPAPPTPPSPSAEKIRSLLKDERRKRLARAREGHEPSIKDWLRLNRILDGNFLDDRAKDGGDGIDPRTAVADAMLLVGKIVPYGTPFEGALLDVIGRSLAMMGTVASLAEMEQAKQMYEAGMAARQRWLAKRDAEKLAKREQAFHKLEALKRGK